MTYKAPRIMITDDEPSNTDVDVRLARWKEWEERSQTMAKLIAGHLAFPVIDNDSVTVTIAVGDNHFSCPRKLYPTTELLAQVTLAVEAGEGGLDSCRIADFAKEELERFTPGGMTSCGWSHELFEENLGNELRYTKGLRP